MDVIYWLNNIRKIRYILVFFCFLGTIAACNQPSQLKDLHVNFDEKKAVNVQFITPLKPENINIYRRQELQIPVMGRMASDNNTHWFSPIVPFTSGEEYIIRAEDRVLGTFEIETNAVKIPPKILSIYPSRDTVPENLLKMYITFSKPMAEVGKVLDHIDVHNDTKNKRVSIFLDQKVELWNREHTRLTLWLDPGRIKRGLIPNEKLGLPLIKGDDYTLSIQKSWRDANGLQLPKTYRKTFIVGPRDTVSPSPETWSITAPSAESKDNLHIRFGEALDAVLTKESFLITDSSGKVLPGNTVLLAKESEINFVPFTSWSAGTYYIEIDSILEDLAGNNLNRLFDTDIQNRKKSARDTIYLSREFEIH